MGLSDIIRKETYIYYRREFTARAQYNLMGRVCTGKIEFVIETEPTGKKDIHVKLVDTVDYPVLPIMQGLRTCILGLDEEGKLP
jgi:hypothetical protein